MFLRLPLVRFLLKIMSMLVWNVWSQVLLLFFTLTDSRGSASVGDLSDTIKHFPTNTGGWRGRFCTDFTPSIHLSLNIVKNISRSKSDPFYACCIYCTDVLFLGLSILNHRYFSGNSGNTSPTCIPYTII